MFFNEMLKGSGDGTEYYGMAQQLKKDEVAGFFV